MSTIRSAAFALTLVLAAPNAVAQVEARGMGGVGISVFTDGNFGGENASFQRDVPDLAPYRLNDRISSLRIANGEYWEVCENANYGGQCQVFHGQEADLSKRGWNDRISSMRRVNGPGQGGGRGGITVFADGYFRGQSQTFVRDVPDLAPYGLNDKASSLRIASGEYWEVCEDANYRGRCQVFYGQEQDLSQRGWNDKISSIRRTKGPGSGPTPVPPNPGPGNRQITLYTGRNFTGASRTFNGGISDLAQYGYNDRAYSARLTGDWLLCSEGGFRGCTMVRGTIPDLGRYNLAGRVSSFRPTGYTWAQGPGRIVMYSQPNYRGSSMTIDDDMAYAGPRMSLQIFGGQWMVCDQSNFQGRCTRVRSNLSDVRSLGLSAVQSAKRIQ